MVLDTGFRRCDGLFSVSLIRSKGIANPFDVFFIACIEQDAVKAAIRVGFCVSRQIMLCSKNDSSLLARGDACSRAAIGRVAAQAHLDKDVHFCVSTNEVNFPATTAKIACYDEQPAFFEEKRCQFLGEVA